jgi:hypothetical protein
MAVNDYPQCLTIPTVEAEKTRWYLNLTSLADGVAKQVAQKLLELVQYGDQESCAMLAKRIAHDTTLKLLDFVESGQAAYIGDISIEFRPMPAEQKDQILLVFTAYKEKTSDDSPR